MAIGRPFDDEADRASTDRPDSGYSDNNRDYSQAQDYSEPAENSAGLGQRPANAPDFQPPSVARDLHGAEVSAEPSAAGDVRDANGVGKLERRRQQFANRWAYRAEALDAKLGDADEKARNAKGTSKIKSKIKKRVIGWALGGTVAIGGIGAGLLGGPAMLLNTITAKLSDGIMNVQQSIMTNHSVRVYRGMLSGNTCSAGIKCKFHTMSARQAAKLEKAGYKLYDAAGNQITSQRITVDTGSGTYETGNVDGARRFSVVELEPPEGVKLSGGRTRLTAGSIVSEMGSNPSLRKSLHGVYNPKFAGFSDSVFGKVLTKAKASKKLPLPDGGSKEDMDKAMKVAVDEGTDAKARTYTTRETTDADGNQAWEVVDENGNVVPDENGNRTFNTEAGATGAKNALDDAARAAAETVEDAAGGAERAVVRAASGAAESTLDKIAGFFSLSGGVGNYVCGIYNGLRAVDIGVKMVRNIALIRLAMAFMSTADSIRAGTATPEQVSYLGTLLTTVLKDKAGNIVANAGTDSAAAKYLLYGDRLGMDQAMLNFKGNGGIWNNLVQGLQGTTFGAVNPQSCAVFRSVGFQAVDLVVGVGVKVVLGIFTGGGSTAAAQGAALAAQTTVKATIGAIIKGVLKDTFGKQALKGMAKSPKFWGSLLAGGSFEVAMAILPGILTDLASGSAAPESDDGGADWLTAWIVGSDEMFKESCKTGGCAPLSSPEAAQYALQTKQTMLAYAEEERVGASPLDITNPYTALGSFASTMSVQMAGAGSVSAFASKLFGMVGFAWNSVLSPYASAAGVPNYECTAEDDPNFAAVGVGCDYLGIPSYGLTETTGLDETIDYVTSRNLINDSGEPIGQYAEFVTNCVDREMPIGSYPLEGQDDTANWFTGMGVVDDGSSCPQSESFKGLNNVYLYNYLIYMRILNSMDEEPNQNGGGSGAAASTAGSSAFGMSAEEIAAAFESATGGSGDFDGAYGRQCVDLSQWFVATYTTLTRSNGNGGDVTANLAAANSGKAVLSDTPQAPAIFSSRSSKYHAVSSCGDQKCGHTGIVVGVNGSQITTLETWNSAGGVKTYTYTWETGDDIQFVYLGDSLK